MKYALLGLLFLVARMSDAVEQTTRPPQGDEGIASKYPGDVGIERDSDVILVEDFEDMPPIVSWMRDGGWFDPKIGPGLGLELTGKIPAAAGRQCLQFNHKKGQKSSGSMMHKLKNLERIYMRYYRRFEKNWQWPDGYGPHDLGLYAYLGNFRSPTKADMFVLLDLWKTGDTVLRIGTPKQTVKNWSQFYKDNYKGMPGLRGGVPWNVSKPDRIENAKWHCIEYMVQLSTPGKKDGIARLWVNGKLVTNITNLPLRDAAHKDMKLRLFFICAYFHPGMPKDQLHWVDQVVLAHKYIGPIAAKKAKPKGKKTSSALVSARPSDPLAGHADAITAAERQVRGGEFGSAAAAYRKVADAIQDTSARARIETRIRGIEARPKIIELIVKGFAADGPKPAFVNFAGRAQRARLVAADAKEGTFRIQGARLPMVWGKIAPVRLGNLAGKYAGGPGDRLTIASFLLAAGSKDSARAQLDKALSEKLSGTQSERARAIGEALR